MRDAMHAVIDKSRSLNNGSKATLASLGYDYVSMDDGWQQCNCSTRQAIDPALPNCSIAMCRGGQCSWHDAAGRPQVNAHRFPDGMKKLVDYGHSLGLKVGSYLNNCICMYVGRWQSVHRCGRGSCLDSLDIVAGKNAPAVQTAACTMRKMWSGLPKWVSTVT